MITYFIADTDYIRQLCTTILNFTIMVFGYIRVSSDKHNGPFSGSCNYSCLVVRCTMKMLAS